MQRSRYIKIIVRALLSVLLLAAAVFAVVIIQQRRAQAELGAVLSAYLSNVVLHDAHDWGSGRGIQIIVQREAQRPVMWRLRWSALFDNRISFPQPSLVTRASFALNNAVASDIHANLLLPNGVDFAFVSRNDLQNHSGDLAQRFPRNLGYIAVSQPGLNFNKTEAIFYIDHFCPLCGGGGYIFMRKINGAWRVVDERFVWAS